MGRRQSFHSSSFSLPSPIATSLHASLIPQCDISQADGRSKQIYLRAINLYSTQIKAFIHTCPFITYAHTYQHWHTNLHVIYKIYVVEIDL